MGLFRGLAIWFFSSLRWSSSCRSPLLCVFGYAGSLYDPDGGWSVRRRPTAVPVPGNVWRHVDLPQFQDKVGRIEAFVTV